jgi:hypothetical protein
VPSTGKCGKLTFADGGEACDQDARCKMGYCLSTGKCPRVIADGEPCTVYNGVFAPPQDAAICDAYSSCVDGKCAPSPYPTCDAAPSADEPVDAGAAGTSAVTPMPCSGALPAPVDVKCPSAQPSEGDACELPTPLPGQGVNLATCTYDKTPCACQPSAKGDGFVWTCEQCPAQKPTAGEACEPLPLIGLCGYADETCGCAPNANGNAWACQACPDAAPANGDSCQVPRLRCGFELKACTCMGWFSPPPPPPHGGPGMRPSSVAPVWICECKIISDECVACMRSACSEPYTAADRAGFAPACDSNSDGCSLPALATCLCDAQTANGPQAACFSAFQTAGDQLAIDLYACTRDACATECGFK